MINIFIKSFFVLNFCFKLFFYLHCNADLYACLLLLTVKGVNFYGPKSEFIVSGSDCGNVFIWHRESARIVNYFHADEGGVVCIR